MVNMTDSTSHSLVTADTGHGLIWNGENRFPTNICPLQDKHKSSPLPSSRHPSWIQLWEMTNGSRNEFLRRIISSVSLSLEPNQAPHHPLFQSCFEKSMPRPHRNGCSLPDAPLSVCLYILKKYSCKASLRMARRCKHRLCMPITRSARSANCAVSFPPQKNKIRVLLDAKKIWRLRWLGGELWPITSLVSLQCLCGVLTDP